MPSIWKAGLGEEEHANSNWGTPRALPPQLFQWDVDICLSKKERGGWINLANATKAIPLWDSQSTLAYIRFWENPLREKPVLEFIYHIYCLHFHALEQEMATHSSVLAWRIPGMGEPGRLPSMGSHRVGHDWSDLAAVTLCTLLLFPHTMSILQADSLLSEPLGKQIRQILQ